MNQDPISVVIIAFIALHASFIAYLGKSLNSKTQEPLLDTNLRSLLIPSPYGFFIKGVNETLFDCSPLISQGEVGIGWQKKVHSLSKHSVAKVPRLFGPAHQECLQKGFSQKVCRWQIMNSIVEEIRWLHKLKHIPGVVNIMSYCVPPNALNDLSDLRVVVEKGEPLTSLSLVQLSWKKRKKIVDEILRMLLVLRDFSFLDFRRQQFVLVDGIPKLSDVDHIQHLPYEDTFMAATFHQEFMPFILTSDAPPLFNSAATQLNSSLLSLKSLLFTDYARMSGSNIGVS